MTSIWFFRGKQKHWYQSLGPETTGQRRTQELSKVSTKIAVRLTGYSNTILHLIPRKHGEKNGKRREKSVFMQQRVRTRFPDHLLASLLKANAPTPTPQTLHPGNRRQGTLVKHQEKATQKALAVLDLPASALSLSYPFPPERQILKDFFFCPTPKPGTSRWRTLPHSVGAERKGTHFP